MAKHVDAATVARASAVGVVALGTKGASVVKTAAAAGAGAGAAAAAVGAKAGGMVKAAFATVAAAAGGAYTLAGSNAKK